MAATACARPREDAVLSANYILASLKDVMSAPFGDGPCMHEALFDDSFLEGTGVTTLDFAKAMIDEGYHPMTMYFPLVVHGAMLIEPTESESKESLDRFIHVLRELALEAKAGKTRALRRRAASGAAPPPGRDRGGAKAGAALEAAIRCRKRRNSVQLAESCRLGHLCRAELAVACGQDLRHGRRCRRHRAHCQLRRPHGVGQVSPQRWRA